MIVDLLRMLGFNPNPTPHIGLFTIIWGGAFIVIGLLMLGFIGSQFLQLRAARSWPTAQGKVLSTRLEQSSREGGTTYTPIVQYEYQVLGTTYTGNVLAFGSEGDSTGYRAAKRKIDEYPVGRLVTVHYDPNKPERAVLEMRVPGGTLMLILSVLFVIVGIIGAIFSAYVPIG